ncbi:hypothetical protein FOZ63_020847 [Perkinsus olseni]|uniref:Uncharacterized protein n=1 Tax=Perkinsus olseni TaxID=32597 RepID=A0A7J6T8W2_PEROL|nr:hypothetical protein FOZ60_016543 [Perkinsus olseni]KAF4740850.1 hypothetical protein FOZ63_020847 [Perkinsus olseni]
MAAQIFSFVVSLYPGRFYRTVGATEVYMDVYESKSVVFLLEGHGLPTYVSGHLPLKGDGSSHSLDIDGAELQELYGNITKFQMSVQDKDLTTFSFNGVDAVSTSLQGETIVLMRVGFEFMPGTFIHLGAGNAPVTLRFHIESDGSLEVAVLCSGKSLLSALQLSRQETDYGSVYYAIESSRTNSLSALQAWVKLNCPLPTHGVYDLSTATIATTVTIYTQLGGVPVALRRRALL